MFNRLYTWVSGKIPGKKRLREENASLRKRIAGLEKKEMQMQLLNTNLKRESDATIAKMERMFAAKLSRLEAKSQAEPAKPPVEVKSSRPETKLLGEKIHELEFKLHEKHQASAQTHQKLLAAQAEIKALRLKVTQLEAEKRQWEKE
jgi:hypothetical protein